MKHKTSTAEASGGGNDWATDNTAQTETAHTGGEEEEEDDGKSSVAERKAL